MTYLQRVAQFIQRFCSGTPQQKKDARYQLVMQLRGFDLRWNDVEDLGLSRERSEAYGNSGGPGLEVVLRALKICPADSILDIGCGKGGAMITLAHWPFRRIDGIEICPRLIEIAQRNLRRLGCVKGTITLCDAAEFTSLNPYNMFYMYHPFPELIMTRVLENIQSSLLRVPREALLIYKNPVCHEVVVQHGFGQVAEFNHTLPPFRIYQKQAEASGQSRSILRFWDSL